MIRNKKLWLIVFTLMCIIAIGVCAIVDYAINSALTWGYIPILSIIFGYLIIMPIFAKKNQILLSLCTLTILILPFLYFIEKITPVKDWYYPLALPIGIVGIIGVWISYLMCRFLKINEWYKISILLFLWGAIINPIINNIADGLGFLSFQSLTNIFSCTVVSLACAIFGYIKQQKKITK